MGTVTIDGVIGAPDKTGDLDGSAIPASSDEHLVFSCVDGSYGTYNFFGLESDLLALASSPQYKVDLKERYDRVGYIKTGSDGRLIRLDNYAGGYNPDIRPAGLTMSTTGLRVYGSAGGRVILNFTEGRLTSETNDPLGTPPHTELGLTLTKSDGTYITLDFSDGLLIAAT